MTASSHHQPPPWFERSFAFSFPVELFPNILSRLRGAPARLEEILRRQSHAMLTAKPQGGWSALENAGHMADLEPLWLQRFSDYVTGRQQLTVTDLANRKTDEARHNERQPEEILTDFRHARETLSHAADAVDERLLSRTLPHPRLNTPMRLVDHLYFVAEHDDHHLARIWQLATGAPAAGTRF